ncbi:hypothetical protein CLIM01_09283 [Colletotrichum limetticola]|uniref:Uncharacterized protein n=1 Tax=Colletotrichum limetticola TaxID=1209924 RepID=A0ABQ9PP84_9PEZI|nr:hypothetical protein CLIM01_09283 [Colletotrichum limetticola]
MSPATCSFFKTATILIRLRKGEPATGKGNTLGRVPPYPFADTPRALITVLEHADAVQTREGFHNPRVM